VGKDPESCLRVQDAPRDVGQLHPAPLALLQVLAAPAPDLSRVENVLDAHKLVALDPQLYKLEQLVQLPLQHVLGKPGPQSLELRRPHRLAALLKALLQPRLSR
jgi:hypothetical protein